jgi:hypothetical protein
MNKVYIVLKALFIITGVIILLFFGVIFVLIPTWYRER